MEPSQLLALMPFAVAAGITLDAAAPDEVTGSLPWARSGAPQAASCTAAR